MDQLLENIFVIAKLVVEVAVAGAAVYYFIRKGQIEKAAQALAAVFDAAVHLADSYNELKETDKMGIAKEYVFKTLKSEGGGRLLKDLKSSGMNDEQIGRGLEIALEPKKSGIKETLASLLLKNINEL